MLDVLRSVNIWKPERTMIEPTVIGTERRIINTVKRNGLRNLTIKKMTLPNIANQTSMSSFIHGIKMGKKVLFIVAIAVIVVAVIALNRWYFDLIVNSDLPNWLKWLFLKG